MNKHINHFTLVMSIYNNVMTWIIWDQYSLFTSEWNTEELVTIMHVYACQSENFLFDAHIHANFSKDYCTNGNLALRQQFYYIFFWSQSNLVWHFLLRLFVFNIKRVTYPSWNSSQKYETGNQKTQKGDLFKWGKRLGDIKFIYLTETDIKIIS